MHHKAPKVMGKSHLVPKLGIWFLPKLKTLKQLQLFGKRLKNANQTDVHLGPSSIYIEGTKTK